MISWQDVPGYFDFQDVYDEAVATAPTGSTLIELGTMFGKSAFYLAQKIKESEKDLHLCVVDTWQPFWGADYAENQHVCEKHGSLFQAFAYYLEHSGFSNKIQVLRMDSAKAAQHFVNVPVHFVFVDADHSYDGCKRDILAWLPRLRRRSIIAGHDYTPQWQGVQAAVEETFRGYGFEIRNNSWLVRL